MSKFDLEWNTFLLGDVYKVTSGDMSMTKSAYKLSGFTAFSASGPDGFVGEYQREGVGIVVSSVGAKAGKVFKASGKWTAIKNTIVIESANEEFDIEYLFYLLSNHVIFKQEGGAQPFISQKQILKTEIKVPPILEQKKIAEIFAVLDKAISKNLLKLKKQYLIAESIMESIEGKFFSSNVKNVKIGEISKKVGSGITPRGGSEIYLRKGVKLIRSQNVLKMKLSLTDVAHIPTSIHKQMHSSSIEPGDTLLNITGASIGRSAVVPNDIGEANVNQHVCIIRTKENCNPYYLSAWLNSGSGQRQINIFQAGGNRQGLNFQQIRSISFPLQPIEVQRAIADSISHAFKSIEKTQRKLLKLQNLKSSISLDLFSGLKKVTI